MPELARVAAEVPGRSDGKQVGVSVSDLAELGEVSVGAGASWWSRASVALRLNSSAVSGSILLRPIGRTWR